MEKEFETTFAKIKKINPENDLWESIESRIENLQKKKATKQYEFLKLAASVAILLSVVETAILARNIFHNEEKQHVQLVQEPLNYQLYE